MHMQYNDLKPQEKYPAAVTNAYMYYKGVHMFPYFVGHVSRLECAQTCGCRGLRYGALDYMGYCYCGDEDTSLIGCNCGGLNNVIVTPPHVYNLCGGEHGDCVQVSETIPLSRIIVY